MDKQKILDYLFDNFNIDGMSYDLISELYDTILELSISESDSLLQSQLMFYNLFIEKLNNCRIDITLQELEELEEEFM